MFLAVIVATATLPSASRSAPAVSLPAYAWSQVLPDGALLVRAVVPPEDECPQMLVGDGRRAMVKRTPRSQTQFDVRLCEAKLAADDAGRLAGVALAGTAGRTLPLAPLKGTIESIVILGDTGCRLTYYKQQACNDAARWPYAKIAAAAAAKRPDLVIHVGDYLYREDPCPDADSACAGSPWGDRWSTWQADFFAPAAPLLAAAPWVAARGNHENCARAGDGWLHFLALREPGASARPCRATVPPVRIELRTLSLFLADTASLTEPLYGPVDRATFASLCRELGAFARRPTPDARLDLLVFHHPLHTIDDRTQVAGFAAAPGADDREYDPVVAASRAYCSDLARADGGIVAPPKALKFMPDTAMKQALADSAVVRRVVAVSGHEHDFQSVFWRDRPGSVPSHQLVVGNGGTNSSAVRLPIVDAATATGDDGPWVTSARCLKRDAAHAGNCLRANVDWRGRVEAVSDSFGYLYLQRVGRAGWRGVLRDPDDRAVAVCGFPGGVTENDGTAIVVELVKDGIAADAMIAAGFAGEGCTVLPG